MKTAKEWHDEMYEQVCPHWGAVGAECPDCRIASIKAAQAEARAEGYKQGFIEGEQHGLTLQTQNDRAKIRDEAFEEAAEVCDEWTLGGLRLESSQEEAAAIRALKSKRGKLEQTLPDLPKNKNHDGWCRCRSCE